MKRGVGFWLLWGLALYPLQHFIELFSSQPLPPGRRAEPVASLYNQLIEEPGTYRVQTGGRLITEEHVGIHGPGTGEAGPLRPRKRRLLHLLPETELTKFFRVLARCGNLQHEIMLRLLFFSTGWVSGLVNVTVTDIDFAQGKIFIVPGKGRKNHDRLFPTSFRLVLPNHLRANPKNRYLFETMRSTPFTPRRVQQIVQHYREQLASCSPYLLISFGPRY
jgi:integrase